MHLGRTGEAYFLGEEVHDGSIPLAGSGALALALHANHMALVRHSMLPSLSHQASLCAHQHLPDTERRAVLC